MNMLPSDDVTKATQDLPESKRANKSHIRCRQAEKWLEEEKEKFTETRKNINSTCIVGNKAQVVIISHMLPFYTSLQTKT